MRLPPQPNAPPSAHDRCGQQPSDLGLGDSASRGTAEDRDPVPCICEQSPKAGAGERCQALEEGQREIEEPSLGVASGHCWSDDDERQAESQEGDATSQDRWPRSELGGDPKGKEGSCRGRNGQDASNEGSNAPAAVEYEAEQPDRHAEDENDVSEHPQPPAEANLTISHFPTHDRTRNARGAGGARGAACSPRDPSVAGRGQGASILALVSAGSKPDKRRTHKRRAFGCPVAPGVSALGVEAKRRAAGTTSS